MPPEIHQETGLPILPRPMPPNPDDVAKMEVWETERGLQMVLTIPAHMVDSVPAMIVQLAHKLVSDKLSTHLGEPTVTHGIAEDLP